MQNIEFIKNENPGKLPEDMSTLGFGNQFTDHMFLMDYDVDEQWHNPRVVPYENISISPAAMIFHYGQSVFEGLKAYRNKGDIYLFRPEENFKRLNKSNERLCIPEIDEEFCLKALKELLKIDEAWIPAEKDTSLYIRPFIIATESQLGVHPANKYIFMIILSPSGPYYSTGLKPVGIYVESNYVRAVKGGMGMAKTGGNYAVSLKSQQEAESANYNQVLWLDGVERKYIEEVGAMNIFFVIDNKIITPEINGSILEGITRKSVIELLKHNGYTVEEKKISIDDITKAYDEDLLSEVFGTGTAAVISPVGHLKIGEKMMVINENKIGKISQYLYDTLTDIQNGQVEDPFGWRIKIKD